MGRPSLSSLTREPTRSSGDAHTEGVSASLFRFSLFAIYYHRIKIQRQKEKEKVKPAKTASFTSPLNIDFIFLAMPIDLAFFISPGRWRSRRRRRWCRPSASRRAQTFLLNWLRLRGKAGLCRRQKPEYRRWCDPRSGHRQLSRQSVRLHGPPLLLARWRGLR